MAGLFERMRVRYHGHLQKYIFMWQLQVHGREKYAMESVLFSRSIAADRDGLLGQRSPITFNKYAYERNTISLQGHVKMLERTGIGA